MNVLFIGYAVESQTADELTGASVAGNKMQLNIIKGLMRDYDVNAITVWPVAAFPKDRSLYIKELDINIIDGFKARRIGFLNVPILKQIWQTVSVYKAAKDYINKETVIFTFNSFPQAGLPMIWLKRKYKCRTVSLLADLPIDDKTQRNFFSMIFRKIFDYLTIKAINNTDKVIVLNKNAASIYAPNTDFLVVEGGIDINEDIYSQNITKTKKNIIYSGALTDYSGILNLVEAMKYVENKNVYLEIYGGGELLEQIINISHNMENVFYCGKVDNLTMRKKQSEAYLLVNPRIISDPISMVTFPSKIFEYMISGTPVLTTKLSGVSEDYLNNMFLVDNNSPIEFSKMINKIMGMPSDELRIISHKAREFIINNKTWEKQSEKINIFINNQASKKEGYE